LEKCLHHYAKLIDECDLNVLQTRLCIGHYALAGLAAPSAKVAANRFLLVEVTDTSTSRVMKSKQSSSLINQVFPNPLRFKQVWHMVRGAKMLYAWKAVPPEGFVAMGMLCTSTGTAVMHSQNFCHVCLSN
jgi:hypothetical protein